MKALVLNGSPRRERSNSLLLTNAFIEGICRKTPAEVEILPLYKMDINPRRRMLHLLESNAGKMRHTRRHGRHTAKNPGSG